jgi:DNA repair photolyase
LQRDFDFDGESESANSANFAGCGYNAGFPGKCAAAGGVEEDVQVSSDSRSDRPRAVGRGSGSNPSSRFLPVVRENDFDQVAFDEEFLEGLERPKTVYMDDLSKSVISENDSPDIPFRYSLNPYRGCLHGCSYCYARPTHEYLGLSAGLDFETRIFVKRNAPLLLRDFLARPNWVCETIMLSGVTDCYQPIERQLRLTRQCLEVALEARQPVSLITKNAMISRDVDLLAELAVQGLCRVALSVNSLDQSLTRVLEPACSAPAARIEAIRTLSSAGVPVHVMVAPVIPGLNDSEMPGVLQAVAAAGAASAGYIMVRLPLTVEPLFREWLRTHRPLEAEKVESRLRLVRGGKLSQSEFHERMRGSGEYADHVGALFSLHRKRCGLASQLPPLRTDLFRPPRTTQGQQFLF